MATRDQVRALVDEGLGYDAVAARLGIRPGLAYLIGTGLAADGSDAPGGDRPGQVPSSQHLANPAAVENPTSPAGVRRWVAERARSDSQMQRAAARRTGGRD